MMLLVLCVGMLTGCATAGTGWKLEEWGEARASLDGLRDVSVAPVVINAPPAADDEVRPTSWEKKWPALGADQLAIGMNDADGDIEAKAGAQGGAVFTYTIHEFYNGDGGGHYMGANPEAFAKGTGELRTRDGRLIVKLHGEAFHTGYHGGDAYEMLCFMLGEEFTSWVESQR
jgi:hypothetical protein